jgi:hypothetical protein
MNKTALLFLATVIAVSGCVSNTSGQNLDMANNQDNSGPLTDSDTTNTFTREDEDSTTTVKTYNSSETYDLTVEQKDEITGDKHFNRYETVNMRSRIVCGFIQQIAYNYSELSDTMNSGSGGLSEGLGSSEDSEIPQWVFEDFEADQVRYTLVSETNGEELSSCEPTEEEINLEVKIERGSANSEGLA